MKALCLVNSALVRGSRAPCFSLVPPYEIRSTKVNVLNEILEFDTAKTTQIWRLLRESYNWPWKRQEKNWPILWYFEEFRRKQKKSATIKIIVYSFWNFCFDKNPRYWDELLKAEEDHSKKMIDRSRDERLSRDDVGIPVPSRKSPWSGPGLKATGR